jgi:hypothetical protein
VTIARARLRHVVATSSIAAALALAGALAGVACDDRTGGDEPGRDASIESAPPAPRADAGESPDTGLGPADGGADASEAGACPAGSTLRRTRTVCPGAALAPPAAFTTDLAGASPGDVVSMAGMNESAAPCLPVVVCTPSDAPTMLFSDSPEAPSQDGVLYADTVNAGRYRFYVYHANGGASLRKFPVVLLNQGAQPAKLTILRKGLAAPSTAYVSVGKTVLLDWFVDRTPTVVTVPAGTRVLLDDALDQQHAAQNELVHAIYDVTTDAPLKVSFVSVPAAADAAAVTAGLGLLTRDVNHQRGTFPAADVLVVPASSSGAAQLPGVQRLRLGLDEVDDTLEGVDAPTGVKQVLLGNYGMLYRLALALPSPAVAAVSARGGGWGGAARVDLTAIALPTATEQLTTTTDAVVLGPVGGKDGGAELRLLSGGGSNLPVDFFLVTP